jgi:hypothetical protein
MRGALLSTAIALNLYSVRTQEQVEMHISSEAPMSKVLSPSNPLNRQSVIPGENVYIRLRDLKPHSSYEIKLSYPATVSHIHLKI